MIIVNARFLTQFTTGVQRFAIEISKLLKKSNLDIEFVSPKNITNHSLAKELRVKKIGILKGHLWEQFELAYYVTKKKGLLISFCNTAPYLIRNQIVTIHDLGFIVHPEWYSSKFSFYYNLLIPKIAARSRHILTVSETSKRELNEMLKIPEEKITVAYNGVAEIFQNAQQKTVKIQSERNFILSVSSHHPRKNFQNLIKAFNSLEAKDLDLIIIGNFEKHFKNNLIDINNSNIKFLSKVSDKDLLNYYKNAEVFVFSSIYEGFGLPLIEAASQNTPLCVSDIPVFREICGDYANYFNPYDLDDIKKNILQSINIKKDSRLICIKYSWEQSAKVVYQLLKNYK